VVAGGTVAAAWWLFAGLFGRPAAAYGAAFLAMAFGVQDHAVAVRPDGLSLLLAVAGSALMIDGLGQAVNRPTISLFNVGLGGLLVGIGICVLTKVLFWAAAIGLPPLVLLFVGPKSIGGRPIIVKALAVFAAGLALPLIAQLSWAAAANDFAQFWYQNFTVNTRFTGTVIASRAALCDTWANAFAWPMISIPLAVFGLAYLLASDTSAARFRSLTCVLLLITSIILILAGAGPFCQYHYAFFVIVTGLSGAAAEPLLRLMPRRGRYIALVLLTATAVGWWYLMVNLRLGTLPLDLRASLQPLQAVLNQSQPDDTFISLQHCNPVFMKDADPGLFMKVVCFADEQQTVQEVNRTIYEKRPAFIVGAGYPIWGPRAELVTIPIDHRLEGDYTLISQQWGVLKRTR